MPSSVKRIYLVLFWKHSASSNSSPNNFKTHTLQFFFFFSWRNKTTPYEQCQDNYSFRLKNTLSDISSPSSDTWQRPLPETLSSALISAQNTIICWEASYGHKHTHMEYPIYKHAFAFKISGSTKFRGSGCIYQHGTLLDHFKEMCWVPREKPKHILYFPSVLTEVSCTTGNDSFSFPNFPNAFLTHLFQ